MDPSNAARLLAVADQVFETTDAGSTWTPVSGVLSTFRQHPPGKQTDVTRCVAKTVCLTVILRKTFNQNDQNRQESMRGAKSASIYERFFRSSNQFVIFKPALLYHFVISSAINTGYLAFLAVR
jgi:hypothetical protein